MSHQAQYTQHFRYKLQRRFRRLHSARYQVYHSVLVQFWRYLSEQPILLGLLDDLAARCPGASHTAMKIVNERKGLLGDTEIEAAAIGAQLIRHCAEAETAMPEVAVGRVYSMEKQHSDIQHFFTEVFVEPLYDYLDEHLDDEGAILAVLRNYKHRTEWFRRGELYEMWAADPKTGEKKLALNLYEYLFDCGISFFIEPESASGRADLVAAQSGDEPLIADAKVFGPKNRSKAYLAQGVRQLYTYCVDYNEAVGYLVVFKLTERELELALDGDQHGTPFFVFNNKRIFFVVVDIYEHSDPASKRGSLRAIRLTSQYLKTTLEEQE